MRLKVKSSPVRRRPVSPPLLRFPGCSRDTMHLRGLGFGVCGLGFRVWGLRFGGSLLVFRNVLLTARARCCMSATASNSAGTKSEAVISQSDQRDVGSWPAFLDYVISADSKLDHRDYIMKLVQQGRLWPRRLTRKATPFFSKNTQQRGSDSLQFPTCGSHASTQCHMDINSRQTEGRD